MHPPRIACLDLDTFFVSVERLLDPSLVGKPVIVGASPGHRGVVTSASYEVRPLGVRSGMSITEARKLAPHAIYLPTRHGVYSGYSREVRAVIEDTTPAVQAASIDEFFLDLRGCERLYRLPCDASDDEAITRAVRELRAAVQRRVGLPASIGLAPCRPLAKIASGLAKPAGVRVVPAGQELAFLTPLPVRKWPGIGPRAEERLVGAGITTLGQLLSLPPGPERARFGGLAESVRAAALRGPRALGEDRPAFKEHDAPGSAEGTLSNERTFHADVGDRAGVEEQLRSLVERVCWRARQRDVSARTVVLKLRTSDFTTVTRSRTLPSPTDREDVVLATVLALLSEAWSGELPVRLVGVGLQGLQDTGGQLALPLLRGSQLAARPAEGRPAVGRAIDEVRERFGYDAIRLGSVGKPTSWLA